MAYNYYPTYQPYTGGYYSSYPQQQIQQYQPQQAIQSAAAAPAQTAAPASIIWVSGIQEAQAYPVAPNAAVALWDQSNPAVYLKQTDASGKPSLKIYDLVERRESPSAASAAPVDHFADYATKDDLKKLEASFTEKIKKLDGNREGVD